VIAQGRHRIEGLIASGEKAMCWGGFRGNTKAGVEVEIPFADVYRFENGTIIWRKTFFYRAAI
jgi:uncharacterized protein